MRIGIDARFLTHPQSGGFKTYTENIVQGLATLDPRNEYILYTDRPGAEDRWRRDNFGVKVVGGPAPVREQVTLPLAMLRDHIQVAHFPCNTAPFLSKCGSVMTIHDLIPLMPEFSTQQDQGRKHRMLTRYWSMVMPAVARRADHIITISQSSKVDIRRMLGIPDERISVVPTGLHPDFRPSDDQVRLDRVREDYGLPNKFIMGFVSSDPRKNSQRLLEAAQSVTSALKNVGLVLICASPDAMRMAQQFSQTRRPCLEPVLLQSVPREDLIAIYNLAEVLAFPSLYEGFGLPVVEAMACGTPVVTSNVSSLPEIVGNAGLTVDPTEPEAIAQALSRIIFDKTLRARLVQLGTERVKDYCWQRTAQETLAVYEKVQDHRCSVRCRGFSGPPTSGGPA